LLAFVSGTAGVVMAYSTMGVIMAFVPPVDMPIDLGLRMDTTTLLFALAVSVLTGVVFGLAPALQSSSSHTMHALKEEGRSGSGGRTTGRLRSALVIAQVAVCLVLLVGATLFLRSFIAAQQLSPGFDASHVVTASMDMFPSGYTGERHRQFQRRAIEAVTAIPGVRSAAFGSSTAWIWRQQLNGCRDRRLCASRERGNRHQLFDGRPEILRDHEHPGPPGA